MCAVKVSYYLVQSPCCRCPTPWLVLRAAPRDRTHRQVFAYLLSMSSLECRNTFLEVVPSSSWFPQRRSQSCEAVDRFADEFLDTRADDLLRRAAGAYAWQSDWPEGISSGSMGHPFLCKAPCIRAVYGTCMKGPRCEFCHLEHNHPKRKLRRQDRQRLEEMPELLVLLILQWHVQRCATKLRLDEPLQLVLAVLERRVNLLRPQLCRI
ncbi:unnamed protein product [Cladocopium goreaui]|uniref:C3H1-type domain-containing protein n=1 Tax=Cladocopium goreaui TaxID=2562237 RepID=A0A9P1FJU2_9DINO|nr:unnamed protein product [Cladocopium goreaui]